MIRTVSTSDITKNIIEMCIEANHYLSKYMDEALKMQLDAIPLIKLLFSEVNPIPIKAALNMRGYNFGIPRLPLIEMSESGKEKLKNLIDKLDNCMI